MTSFDRLYEKVVEGVEDLGKGLFRLADIIPNPPAVMGRKFRDDVVKRNRFKGVKRVGADEQSVIYEKEVVREDRYKR